MCFTGLAPTLTHAFIPRHVAGAVRSRCADGIPWETVHAHRLWGAGRRPFPPGVLEIAGQFLLPRSTEALPNGLSPRVNRQVASAIGAPRRASGFVGCRTACEMSDLCGALCPRESKSV
jgi:hypothetical protein